MSNKGMRRYKRHQEKHRGYFEALAREVVIKRKTIVDLGLARSRSVFEVEIAGWISASRMVLGTTTRISQAWKRMTLSRPSPMN
jgi:hypothetical protein